MIDGTVEPTTVVAGDSWAWSRPDLRAAWPASAGWSLSYVLAPEAGGTPVTIAAGAEFDVSLAGAATAGYAPGAWRWVAMVSDGGGHRHTVGEGRLMVRPDPAAAVAADVRTWAERILAAVEAVLEGRATADHEAYSIEGRSVTRIPVAELQAWRARLRREVAELRGASPIEFRRVAFKP